MFTSTQSAVTVRARRYVQCDMELCETVHCLFDKNGFYFVPQLSFRTMCCNKYTFNSLEIGCVINFTQRIFIHFSDDSVFHLYPNDDGGGVAAATSLQIGFPTIVHQHSLYFWRSFFFQQTTHWYTYINLSPGMHGEKKFN